MILNNGLNKSTFIYSSGSLIIITLFFAAQKDLGSALIFSIVYLTMLFSVDKKLYFTLISSGVALTMAIMSFYSFNHVKSRIEAWLNP